MYAIVHTQRALPLVLFRLIVIMSVHSRVLYEAKNIVVYDMRVCVDRPASKHTVVVVLVAAAEKLVSARQAWYTSRAWIGSSMNERGKGG